MELCTACEEAPVHARGWCVRCYGRARHNGWNPEYRYLSYPALVEEFRFLREAGLSFGDIAAKLDRTPAALERALYRAGERGFRPKGEGLADCGNQWQASRVWTRERV